MRLAFLKDDKFWKWVLLVGIGIFFLVRLLTLTSFPIFNDETIYIQYSQLIHEDFDKNKFISEGGLYADWKPPLQYWFGSIFFGFIEDPLVAGRVASLVISTFGLWGLYLFLKELLGKKESSLGVFMYAIFPPAIFFNIQFVAETYVFSLAPWVYWFFLKAIRSDRVRILYALGAVVFGAMLLLAKQSGLVYLVFSLLLVITALPVWQGRSKTEWKHWNWRAFMTRFGVIAAGILAALLLQRVGISTESIQTKNSFVGNWVMSLGEVMQFPWDTWRTSFIQIRDYYYSYYSVFILLPILYFFFAVGRRFDWQKLIACSGFLGTSAAVLIFLRGFNEYIYNTAVIVFLLPLLAIAFFAAISALSGRQQADRALGFLVLISFVAMFAHWIYQDALMRGSPADYIRRGTSFARYGYLENWSGGFGVAETIARVKAMEQPALILADGQWGNPRTALEVYIKDSPALQVIGLTSDFRTEQGTLAARELISSYPFQTRAAAFSSATNEVRKPWQDNIEKYMCDIREEIQVEPDQPPIVICKF